jgi:phosphate transport system substrate-binding protein
MNDAKLKEYRAKRGVAILHFPTVLGADVPTYNIPGVTAELKFTPEALAGIFLGKITKWDDPQLRRTNPEAELPNHEIVVAFRSDCKWNSAFSLRPFFALTVILIDEYR